MRLFRQHVMADPNPAAPDATGTSPKVAWRLPRRNYVLLPLIFVMTIALLLVACEVAARSLYVQDEATEPCGYPTLAGFILGTMAGRVGEVLRSRYSRPAFASAMMIGSLVLNRSSSGIVCKQF